MSQQKNNNKLMAVIMAAGKGKRMHSALPKVLHKVKGKTLIYCTIEAVSAVATPIVVVGYQKEQVIKELNSKNIKYVYQEKQLGTAHALMSAKDLLKNYKGPLFVLPGDHPFVSPSSLKNILKKYKNGGQRTAIVLGTITVPSYRGIYKHFYSCGRIIRDPNGKIKKIVELKDATDEEKSIKEVNVSYYCFNSPWVWQALKKIKNKNEAKEYYLTDLIYVAQQEEKEIEVYKLPNFLEGFGINTQEQLKTARTLLK